MSSSEAGGQAASPRGRASPPPRGVRQDRRGGRGGTRLVQGEDQWYELARSGLKPRDVENLLDVYGVRGNYRNQLLTLAEEATRKGWWEAYADILTEEHQAFIGLEAEATSVLQWQTHVVPGLLQTREYAWQIFAGYQDVRALPPTVIERRVQTRLIRQQLLTADPPLALAVVLDESVLRRQWGDRAVMYEQLQHLAAASELPNVTLQVLPLEGRKGSLPGLSRYFSSGWHTRLNCTTW